MPNYDYQCDGCGYTFEIFQGMLEKKLATCPKCGDALRRLIGAGAGVVFRGNGFYQTDYRSSEYRKRAKEESGKSSGKGGDAKTSNSSGVTAKESPKG